MAALPVPKPADFVNQRDGNDKKQVKALEKRIYHLFCHAFPGVPIEEQLQWNSDYVLDDSKSVTTGYPISDVVINFANNHPVFKLKQGSKPTHVVDPYEALFFIEPTLKKNNIAKYIANKIGLVNRVLDGKGGKNDVVARAVKQGKKSLVQGSKPNSANILYIPTPNSQSSEIVERTDILHELNQLAKAKAPNPKFPKLAGCKLDQIQGGNGFKFESSNGIELLVAQLSIEDITEVAHMVEQYQKKKKKGGPPSTIVDAFSDRMMWLLTRRHFSNHALLFDGKRPSPIDVTIFENDKSGVKSKHADGINVTISGVANIKRHMVKMKLKDLTYLAVIPRTISSDSSLQRLPIAKKMKMIAEENLATGEPFPTPVVIVAERSNLFLKNNVPKRIHGPLIKSDETNPIPYSANLVDGQHRVLSYYFSNGSAHNFDVDIVWYELPDNITSEDKSSVMSKLFFDINFRAQTPDAALYYTHCSKMVHEWPDGWRKNWSARAHATRFLFLLNTGKYLEDYFQFEGIKGTGEGIKSTVTYLQDEFDFRWMNKKGSEKNPKALCWRRYAEITKSGKAVVIGDPKAVFPDLQNMYSPLPGNINYGPIPSHQSLDDFWYLLVSDFTKFLDGLNLGASKYSDFQRYCSASSSLFTAIFSIFSKIIDQQYPVTGPLSFNTKALGKIGQALMNLDKGKHSMKIDKSAKKVTKNVGFNAVSGAGGVNLFIASFVNEYNSEKSVKAKL